MFVEIYDFFYQWLFDGVQPAFLSTQGAEFTCIVFTIVTLLSVVALVITPIRALISWLMNWR